MQLEKAGHRCTSIGGHLDHQLRDRVVNEFRTGITKILISTDVLSRGFDVTQACALSASSLQSWQLSLSLPRIKRIGHGSFALLSGRAQLLICAQWIERLDLAGHSGRQL